MTASPTSLALEVINLNKSYGGLLVTRDVSLAVKSGERRLIIGPNGAGKTTLFNQISGDLRSNSGTVTIFGTDVTHLPPYRRAHLGLSRTYQVITLFAGDTLEHNVALGLLGLRPARWQMWRTLASYDEISAEARQILDAVGLLDLASRPVSEIAYGERRRTTTAHPASGRAFRRLVRCRKGHSKIIDSARHDSHDDRTRHGYCSGPRGHRDIIELRPCHC